VECIDRRLARINRVLRSNRKWTSSIENFILFYGVLLTVLLSFVLLNDLEFFSKRPLLLNSLIVVASAVSLIVICLWIFQRMYIIDWKTWLEPKGTVLFGFGAAILFLVPLSEPITSTDPFSPWRGSGLVWGAIGTVLLISGTILFLRASVYIFIYIISFASVFIFSFHNMLSFNDFNGYSIRDMNIAAVTLFTGILATTLFLAVIQVRKLSLLGIAFRGTKRIKEAYLSVRSAIKINPFDELLWNNLGNILSDMKRYPEALACYERALKIDPYFQLAKENRDETLRRYGKFSKITSGSRFVCPRKQNFMSQWWRKSLYLWICALGVLTTTALGLSALLWMWGSPLMSDGYVSTEILAFTIIPAPLAFIAMNRFVKGFSTYGTILRRCGDYQGAQRYYLRALRLNPFNDITWNNLGNLYTDMGMYDKAQACYSRSLSLFPTQDTATKNREFMLTKSGRKWRRPGTFID